MKGSNAALFFGILIISIGIAWIVTGGPAEETAEVAVTVVPTPTLAPATLPVTAIPTPEPVVTTASPVPVLTAPPVPATIVTTATPRPENPVSADQVRDHFLNIAYSATNKIERLNYTAGQDRIIISVISPDGTDRDAISASVKEFNEISREVRISEMIKESGSGDIVIKFIPESGLANILLNDIPDSGPNKEILTRREFSSGGKPAAKVMRGTIYINSNLKGDARNHTIARSLFYELGVTGETTNYPDSLFFAGDNTNTRLNSVDRKAIAILYEPGLANTMTLEDLRKLMYIP